MEILWWRKLCVWRLQLECQSEKEESTLNLTYYELQIKFKGQAEEDGINSSGNNLSANNFRKPS